MRIAIAQIDPCTGAFEDNVRLALDFARRAMAKGADLLVFPAYALSGDAEGDMSISPAFVAQARGAVNSYARKCQIPTIMSTYFGAEEGDDLCGFPGVFLCQGGKASPFVPGDEDTVPAFEFGGKTFVICFDQLADFTHQTKTPDCVLELSADYYKGFESLSTSKENSKPERSCARGAHAYVIRANLVGGADECVYSGGSFVMDPTGTIVAGGYSLVEHLVVADMFDRPVTSTAVIPDSENIPFEGPVTSSIALEEVATATHTVAGDEDVTVTDVEVVADGADTIVTPDETPLAEGGAVGASKDAVAGDKGEGLEADPTDAEVNPAGAEASPADTEANPEDSEANPENTQADPVKDEASPAKDGTDRDEVGKDGADEDEVDSVAPVSNSLASDWKALVLATRDYIHKNGFTDCLVGLSGGIDSAVVATIATDALGPEHVHACLMPGPYSSEGSVTDAQEIARIRGFSTVTIPINEPLDTLCSVLAEPCGGEVKGLAHENMQARIRTIYLMTLSNTYGWVLLNTGNKSESAMGFSTLYGDTAGAFAPLGDVYKTRVFELANWRNGQGVVIPRSVINKAPSAELYEGQRDDDRLPAYRDLDEVLREHVEGGLDLTELIAEGLDPQLCAHVVHEVCKWEFKRRQEPLAPCISDFSFNERAWPVTNRFSDRG